MLQKKAKSLGLLGKLKSKYGFSWGDFSLKTGILAQTLWAIESDNRNFSVGTLVKIKNGLQLDWDEIGKMLEEYEGKK